MTALILKNKNTQSQVTFPGSYKRRGYMTLNK